MADGPDLSFLWSTLRIRLFSPGDSKDRYLGIWYKNMSLTVVWVANRTTNYRSIWSFNHQGRWKFSPSQPNRGCCLVFEFDKNHEEPSRAVYWILEIGSERRDW
ncbi:hypothetical protein HHK36_033435 [Tetracentron sinense]|uniref:Uncharacterized protein n=1 Tax=Tetracentron sinense TaxID=13715 RepID=A0A835CWT2_TETSI|nr:hypothetical protein HHK36_033435 [Tetracentron sinense]